MLSPLCIAAQALAEHSERASGDMLSEARKVRDRLKARAKKNSAKVGKQTAATPTTDPRSSVLSKGGVQSDAPVRVLQLDACT